MITETEVLEIVQHELQNGTIPAQAILNILGLKVIVRYEAIAFTGKNYPDTPEGRYRKRKASGKYRQTDKGKKANREAVKRYFQTPQGKIKRKYHKRGRPTKEMQELMRRLNGE